VEYSGLLQQRLKALLPSLVQIYTLHLPVLELNQEFRGIQWIVTTEAMASSTSTTSASVPEPIKAPAAASTGHALTASQNRSKP